MFWVAQIMPLLMRVQGCVFIVLRHWEMLRLRDDPPAQIGDFLTLFKSGAGAKPMFKNTVASFIL